MDNNKNIYSHFITGADVSPEINLCEGYISIWQTKNNEQMIIKCFQCPDSHKFYYGYTFQTEKEVNDIFLNDLSEQDRQGILNYTGQTFDKFMSGSLINKISDIDSYNGWFFTIMKENCKNTIEEVLDDLELIY
jgi:hypothetical protein